MPVPLFLPGRSLTWPRKNCRFFLCNFHMGVFTNNVLYFLALLARPPRKVLLDCETTVLAVLLFSLGRFNSGLAQKVFRFFPGSSEVEPPRKSFTRTLGLLGSAPNVQDMNTRLLSANLDFDSRLLHVSCRVPDECPDS